MMVLRRFADKPQGWRTGPCEDEDWTTFFPSGTRVMALPGWRRPRLLLHARNYSQRWEHSSLYPASRLRAKLYRSWLRLRATTGLARTQKISTGDWPLKEFVEEMLPELSSAVISVGTPGPAQGLTVQLRDERDRVLGYLKYTKKVAARKRLHQERHMLSNLPGEIGPTLMKFGPLGGGEALLKSPIVGKPPSAVLPPPKGLFGLLGSLAVSPPMSLEAHPWVRQMRDRGASDIWFEPLAKKDWPVVIQHGDFVPWNLLVRPDGAFRAVDWEYGTLEGFPYLDLAHYLLQTSALIYRRTPTEALQYAVKYLSRHPETALDPAEAQALARLSAYSAYRASSEDGQFRDVGLQPWRRAIWESTTHEDFNVPEYGKRPTSK